MIECLEPRIAPAVITVIPSLKTATWIDHDGDFITMKWSSAVPPTFVSENNGLGLLVDRITLTPADHTNASFSIAVKANPGGDGRVQMGRVDGTGTPIISWISPLADIAEFDIGNGTRAVSTSLVMGALGSIPHSSFTNNAGDGDSFLNGVSGIISIRGDIGSASLTTGVFKSLAVLGSVRGDAAGGSAIPGLLTLNTNGTGIVSITGSLIGGNSINEGHINVTNRLTSLAIRGSIIGGSAPFTGVVDIAGTGTINAVSILGSIIGGSATDTGTLNIALTDTVVAVTVGGNILGGTAERSGVVNSGPLTTFTLGGSLFGGEVQNTGDINLQRAGTVTIKGSIWGGRHTAATANSFIGTVNVTDNLRTLAVNGDIVAGTYASGTHLGYNGAVLVGKNLTTATIRGSLIGNAENNVFLMAGGVPPTATGDYTAIGRVQILGSVNESYIASGHTADLSSYANRVGNAENPDAGIGSMLVIGDWSHSNLNGALNDVGGFGLSLSDTHSVGDPNRTARIGAVVIKGHIQDNPQQSGFSGFAATKLASLSAAGVLIFKTGNPNHSTDPFQFVDVFET